MYGLKRLASSASHLRALVTSTSTSPAAATSFVQLQSKADAATYHTEVPMLHSKNVAIGASKDRNRTLLKSENVAMVTCKSSAAGGTCNVYLVGTFHGTPESKREVEAVIQYLKPQVVFLELCSSRLDPEIEDQLKRAGRHAGQFEIQGEAGKSEFIAGYVQAIKCGGKVILGDRPINITIRRAAAKVSIWDLIKRRCIELKLLPKQDFWEQHHHYLHESLLDARDQYMSAKILETAREHNLVVAVVGKNHLAGIQKYWKQPLERLLSVPKYPMTPHVFLGLGSIIVAAVIFSR